LALGCDRTGGYTYEGEDGIAGGPARSNIRLRKDHCGHAGDAPGTKVGEFLAVKVIHYFSPDALRAIRKVEKQHAAIPRAS